MFFLSLFAYFEFSPWDDLPPCSIVEGDYWILSLYFDHVQCSIPGIFKENSCTFSVSTFLVYKHTSYLSPKILLCDGDLRHFVARKFSLFYAFFKRCKKWQIWVMFISWKALTYLEAAVLCQQSGEASRYALKGAVEPKSTSCISYVIGYLNNRNIQKQINVFNNIFETNYTGWSFNQLFLGKGAGKKPGKSVVFCQTTLLPGSFPAPFP